MPMIPPDSPVRRVPVSVHRKTILFLDGIRYSIEAFELASLRLARTLHTFGSRECEGGPELASLLVEATSDAWTMVDTVHRLRRLVVNTPRLKQKDPEVQLFLRTTRAIEDLRNYIQHCEREIHDFEKRGLPLWGTLVWATDQRTNHMLVPGTWFADASVQGCTFDSLQDRFVERVVLRAGIQQVELADLSNAVERFARWYIAWFEQMFSGDDRYGADLHMKFMFVPHSGKAKDGAMTTT